MSNPIFLLYHLRSTSVARLNIIYYTMNNPRPSSSYFTRTASPRRYDVIPSEGYGPFRMVFVLSIGLALAQKHAIICSNPIEMRGEGGERIGGGLKLYTKATS